MSTPPAPTAPTPGELQEFTDGRTFNRGRDYFLDRSVGPLQCRDGGVKATVHGSSSYAVWLAPREAGFPDFECNCHVGLTGELCKHVIALGLRWHQATIAGEVVARDSQSKLAEELAPVMAQASRQDLVRWLTWAVQANPGLHQRIVLAARHTPAERAEQIRHDSITALNELAESGLPETEERRATELRQAHQLVQDLAIEEPLTAVVCLQELIVDLAALTGESSEWGEDPVWGDTTHPALRALYRLHRTLADQHTPEPKALANWLFERGCAYDEMLEGLPLTYAKALGAEGLAHFRSRVQNAWEILPILTAEARPQGVEVERAFLQAQLELLVHAASPVDQVRVLQKDLSSSQRFCRILECLSRSESPRDYQLAVDWADRAVRTFSSDEALVSHAARAHLRSGDAAEACRLLTALFQAHPDAHHYRLGAAVLSQAPTVQTKFCEDALALLRLRCAEQEALSRKRLPTKTLTPAGRQPPKGVAPYGSVPSWAGCDFHAELGLVLIQRGDAEQLWAHHLKKPLSDKLWCEIAELRASNNLDDALTLWRELMPRAIARCGTDYAEPTYIVRAMHAACDRGNASGLFERERALLRTEYRRRRNFMKQLDELS